MDDERDRRGDPPVDGPETGPVSSLDPESVRVLVLRSGVGVADVEDVAQDALVEVWQRGETTVTGMVVIRAARAAARRHRRRAQREVLTPDGHLEAEDDWPDPEARAIQRSLVSFFWHVLLPAVHPLRRRVLIEHDIEGASLAEIAAREGITEEAAKKRLQRARGEIVEVKERKEAAERRRRKPVRAVLLPMVRDLAASRGKRPLLRMGLKSAALAVMAWAIVASSHATMTKGGVGGVAGAALMVPTAAPGAAVAEAGIGAGAAVAPPKADAAPVPAVADAFGTTRPIRDFEHSLLKRATSALDTGGPANIAEALALLRFHQREFPDGRHAAQREALLRRILTSAPKGAGVGHARD